MCNDISTRDVQFIFFITTAVLKRTSSFHSWFRHLVEFATFKFATCSLLTCRNCSLLHSTTVNYAHIMSIIYKFPQMIYGNFCGSYLKKILSSSTKDSSYKHMASPWELRHQLLSLPFYGKPRKATVNG